MFFLGLLSLIQAWFLPGFVATSFLKRINIYDKIILAFPLSIIINYIAVFLLILLNSYNFFFVLLIIFFELVIIFAIYKNMIKKINKFQFNIKINYKYYFIDIFLILIFLVYFFIGLSNIGEITHQGDPLVMWDLWAKSFAQNIIPNNTMDYPQAYPILMSITYVLIGSLEIEFFSRTISLIYPIMIWVIMIRILVLFPKYNKEIKITLFFIAVLTLNQFRHTLYLGFVDPLLVFATVSLGYILMLGYLYKFQNSEIILLCLIAIIPGLLKQTSLYLTVLFPIIFYFINFDSKKYFKIVLIYLTLAVIILFPWYIYKLYLFQSNHESFQALNLSFFSNTNEFVNRGYEEIFRSLFLNFIYGLKLAFGKLYPLIFIMIVFGYFKNYYSKVLTFLILPYFLIWSNVFANDARNFAFMLPIISYILSCSTLLLITVIKKYLNKIFKTKFSDYGLLNNLLLIVFVCVSIFIIIEKRNADNLLIKQYEKQVKRTSYPNINLLLYRYFENKSDKNIKIIMYSRDFLFLPSFENSLHLPCDDKSVEYLKKNFSKEFYYLFKIDSCSKYFKDYFSKIPSKKIIFEYENHFLWKNE